MKLVKLILALAVLGAIAVAVSQMGGSDEDTKTSVTEKKAGDGEGVRLEEKYGFTGEQALP